MFNMDLQAEQVWLFSCGVMEAPMASNSSYIWRHILHSKEVLR